MAAAAELCTLRRRRGPQRGRVNRRHERRRHRPIDTRSGHSVGYPLPESTNILPRDGRQSTTPVTFWVGNNHRGKIIKLEPLD
jgi:hypothetical protein